MTGPTDEEIISASGDSKSHARVVARASAGSVLAALIDTNGDDRLVDFEVLDLGSDGGWHVSHSTGAGSYGSIDLDGVANLHGQSSEPEVIVEFAGQQPPVPVGTIFAA